MSIGISREVALIIMVVLIVPCLYVLYSFSWLLGDRRMGSWRPDNPPMPRQLFDKLPSFPLALGGNPRKTVSVVLVAMFGGLICVALALLTLLVLNMMALLRTSGGLLSDGIFFLIELFCFAIGAAFGAVVGVQHNTFVRIMIGQERPPKDPLKVENAKGLLKLPL